MLRIRTLKVGSLAALSQRGRIDNLSKSAVRALDVLELLVDSAALLREIDIARALNVSPSSADQILKTMVDSGYLLLDAMTKRYRLAPRMMRVAAALEAAYPSQQVLDALMRGVHCDIGATVLLAAPQHSYMQVIDVYDGHTRPGALACPGVIGLHTPFFGSCTGAAWLSPQPEAHVRRLIKKHRRELGVDSCNTNAILANVAHTKRQGYAFGGLLTEKGWLSIAMPLPPASNGVVLVLIVTGAARSIEAREGLIVRALKRRLARGFQT